MASNWAPPLSANHSNDKSACKHMNTYISLVFIRTQVESNLVTLQIYNKKVLNITIRLIYHIVLNKTIHFIIDLLLRENDQFCILLASNEKFTTTNIFTFPFIHQFISQGTNSFDSHQTQAERKRDATRRHAGDKMTISLIPTQPIWIIMSRSTLRLYIWPS